MKNIITLIVVATLLCGCYATKMAETMQSYMGHTKGTVIRNFGPPAAVTSNGDGGEILIYAVQNIIYTPPGGYPYGVPQHDRVYWNYKMFYIGKDNCVYHWRIDKMEVPPGQVYLYLR